MIRIIDDTNPPKGIWPSEIRVKENKSVRKLLKYLKNPEAKSEEAKKVLVRSRSASVY